MVLTMIKMGALLTTVALTAGGCMNFGGDFERPVADAAPPDAEPLPDAAPPPPDAPPPLPACDEPVNVQQSGHHFPGQDCTGLCHDGMAGPDWTVAGTLYTKAIGGVPIAGATITVKDANGKIVKMVSAQNGNFWTAAILEFPVTTWASECPDLIMMEAKTGGGCNANNCHDNNFRVYLPQAP
jgi:hypothetical protein